MLSTNQENACARAVTPYQEPRAPKSLATQPAPNVPGPLLPSVPHATAVILFLGLHVPKRSLATQHVPNVPAPLPTNVPRAQRDIFLMDLRAGRPVLIAHSVILKQRNAHHVMLLVLIVLDPLERIAKAALLVTKCILVTNYVTRNNRVELLLSGVKSLLSRSR